jgi:PBP superfamily domain
MLRARGARWRRWPALVGVAALLTALWGVGAPVAGTDAQTTGEARINLEVSQSTNLVDGQVLDVVVTPAPGTTLVAGVTGQLRLCQRDASFSDGEAIGSPPQDLQSGRGKCPAFGSPFASSDATRTGATLHPMPDATRMLGAIRVGVGTTEPSEPNEVPLTCDPDNPCTLVAFAPVSPGVWAADTVTLSFAPPDPAAVACGAGAATGAISTIGPDRMSAANVAWTAAQCRATGDKKSSNFVAAGADAEDPEAPAGEQRALADLAKGNRDLAYSAVGPRTPGFEPSTPRDVVAVPVAVNAMVVGLAGGYQTENAPDWPARLPHPFHDVKLTADELASLFGRSLHSHFRDTYGPAVAARNRPQFEVSLNRTEGGGIIPVAYGGPHAGTRFFTSYLDTLAPDVWKASPTPGDGPDRGVYAKLANVTPDFTNVIETVSAMAGFEKAYFGVQEANNVFGPGYFLTDYATAKRLGLDLVSIQNAAGEFVAPTPDSITKGLSTMSAQPDGTLAPDPTEAQAGAYPLTMVEYALAPAGPLVDTERSCRRADSQGLLGEWLTFITGDGQAVLDDFVPLTGPLRSEAASAVADVGAAAPAGTPTVACGSGVTPTTPTAPGGPTSPPSLLAVPPFDLGLSQGLGTGAGAFGSVGGAAGVSGGTQRATAAAAREAKKAAEEADIKIPPFMGIAAVSEIISPLALLLIAVLTSMVAFGTSGRPVPVPSGVSRRLGRRRVPRAPASRRGLARMLPRR